MFLSLHDEDGNDIFVNPLNISYMRLDEDSKITIIGMLGGTRIYVKQTINEILETSREERAK